MTSEDLAALTEQIEAQGFLPSEPIVLHENRILDGRNRWRACLQLDEEGRLETPPTFVEWDGNSVSPLDWVLARDLTRRHLSPGQKAMVAVAAALHQEEEAARLRQLAGLKRGAALPVQEIVPERGKEQARDRVAKLFAVNAHYVQDAKRLRSEAPDLAEEVLAGTLTLPQALRELKKRGQVERPDGTASGSTSVPEAELAPTAPTAGSVAEEREALASDRDEPAPPEANDQLALPDAREATPELLDTPEVTAQVAAPAEPPLCTALDDSTPRLPLDAPTEEAAEYMTPAEIAQAIAATLPRGVDIVPHASALGIDMGVAPVAEPDGALAREWSGRLLLDLTGAPPNVGDWLRKLRQERKVAAAVVLAPAITDAPWFRQLEGAQLCFFRRRIRGDGSGERLPYPCVAAFVGPDPTRFKSAFAALGWSCIFFDSAVEQSGTATAEHDLEDTGNDETE